MKSIKSERRIGIEVTSLPFTQGFVTEFIAEGKKINKFRQEFDDFFEFEKENGPVWLWFEIFSACFKRVNGRAFCLRACSM